MSLSEVKFICDSRIFSPEPYTWFEVLDDEFFSEVFFMVHFKMPKPGDFFTIAVKKEGQSKKAALANQDSCLTWTYEGVATEPCQSQRRFLHAKDQMLRPGDRVIVACNMIDTEFTMFGRSPEVYRATAYFLPMDFAIGERETRGSVPTVVKTALYEADRDDRTVKLRCLHGPLTVDFTQTPNKFLISEGLTFCVARAWIKEGNKILIIDSSVYMSMLVDIGNFGDNLEIWVKLDHGKKGISGQKFPFSPTALNSTCELLPSATITVLDELEFDRKANSLRELLNSVNSAVAAKSKDCSMSFTDYEKWFNAN